MGVAIVLGGYAAYIFSDFISLSDIKVKVSLGLAKVKP